MTQKKIFSIFITVILITALFSGSFCIPVRAVSDVRIGQARKGEHAYKNNKPGDQTGKEVMISDWSYSPLALKAEHWEYVMRPKDPEVARLIAKTMTDACSNEKIGYDQNDSDRGSLYDAAKKADWDLTKVNKKCETTCSCLISVCLNAAGIKMPRLWMTRDMKADMDASGQFYCFTAKNYLRSSSNLTVGDILINPGKHAVIVVESPNPYTFPVAYTDENGKKQKTQIAVYSEVTLNLNNGEDPLIITIEGETDLKAIVPEKKDFEFLGWQKTSKSSFSAIYKSDMPSMRIDSPAISISG